jgi:hypothetical protein
VTKTRLERIFDEIVKHVRWTGDVILSADNPAAPAPKIGWCTETGTRSWSISASHVRQDLNAMQDQTKADLLRKYMMTSAGRVSIARSFPGQRDDAATPPVFECPRCNSRTWVPGYSASSHSEEECDECLTSSIHDS